MRSAKELTECFMFDLKHYNNTNFKTIAKADLSKQDATVHKAFSSVITRYFIFREKHPEVTEREFKMLYFALSLDLVASYFSEYPNTTTDYLVAFQMHLKKYMKDRRHKDEDTEENENDKNESSVSDIGLESNNTVQVEQQQESQSVAI